MNEPIPMTPVPNPYYGVPYPYPTPEPKPLMPLGKGDTAFAVMAVGVCMLWSALGLFGGVALGYLISAVAVLLLMGVYLAKGGRVNALSVASGALALGLSAVFVCTSNNNVRFFAVVVGFLLALCCFHSLAVGPAAGNRGTAGIFYTAVATTGNIGVALRSLFSNENGEKKAVGKALLGVACSLPLLLIVVPLLLSSDAAFQGMMDSLFGDGTTTLAKCVFGVGVAFLLVPYGLSLKHRRTVALGESRFTGIEGVYILSFLSLLSLVYVLYLFSQLAYFFSAFRGFLPEGDITVAQYARTGFFEMSVIAAINLGVVIGAMVLAKKKAGKASCSIKAVCTFIAGFTLIIIATALSKMVLYIGSFGMTELRLTTSAFMVFLAAVFVATLLRLYWRRINVVKTALLTAGLLVLVLGVGNVNAVCARYNYEAWQSGTLESIDVAAMYRLGDEGIPYVVKLADSTDVEVAEEAREWLEEAYRYDYFDNRGEQDPRTLDLLQAREYGAGFSHYSLPRAEAYESLYAYYESHPEFVLLCWPEEETYEDDTYWYDDGSLEEWPDTWTDDTWENIDTEDELWGSAAVPAN